MNEEEVIIRDCYGTILAPNDIVITHTQYDSDPGGLGIVKCKISHKSSGSSRIMLKGIGNPYQILQRFPIQVIKIDEKQIDTSN